ncbi:phage tail domain-containing protein [Vallitalea okinawensis]|uniref:phage tail domain-containing protein n=1 Tax=Vallitalea okinawensis TaxID=2078660 RepID=UPI000CFCB3F6|nr:phage tail domain-containing protein [Vallitalea okinawensis]
MFTGKISLGEIDLYSEFDLVAVELGGGMSESHFGITQKVIEETSSELDIPHFFGLDRQPFSFTLSFARVNNKKWDYDTKLKFAKLISTPYYQELKSAEYPQVVYHVICVDVPKKVMNGIDQGYITLKFRTDAPWGWSPSTVITKVITGASDGAPYTFELENKSNILQWYYPEVEFIVDGTEIKISNNKDSDREFKITGLYDREVIYVNNQTKKVIGDQPYPLNYRLNNFNKNWLRLRYGVNKISVYRDCTVTFKMQYPVGI